MAMVVRSNLMAYNANRQLGMNNSAVSKNLEKLSSGFKINRAADDAAGLAISEKMKSQIKGLEQASLNSQDGVSLIQTAEGALTETHDMLNRLVELATKSSNGTIADAVDREAIVSEANALITEMDRIASSTNFNKITLLDSSLDITLQVGETAADIMQVTVGDMTGATLVGAIDLSTRDGASTALDTINTAINTVSTERAKLGALQNRLEHNINNLDVTAENMTNANSRIRDTDMAKQMMEYTKMNVLTQSAQAMLAQANQNPQSVLQLLQ